MPRRSKTYDEKCLELATHFLQDEGVLATEESRADLAAHIQVEVEQWIEYERQKHRAKGGQ